MTFRNDEDMALFNGLNVALATIRYVGVVPVLAYVSDAPVIFFAYQAGVGVLSVGLFSSAVRRSVTHRPPPGSIRLVRCLS